MLCSMNISDASWTFIYSPACSHQSTVENDILNDSKNCKTVNWSKFVACLVREFIAIAQCQLGQTTSFASYFSVKS